MKFSILILTLPSRINSFFPKITEHLQSQIGNRNDIEILALYDNKRRSVGEKRNALLDLARGKYLTFIDDDDRVSDDYISSIMKVIDNENTDCIVFDCMCTINNQIKRYCKYGIEYNYTCTKDHPVQQWTGKPAHTMVYRSEIAKKYRYPEKNRGEDMSWVSQACLDIKKQSRIDKLLYYYDFNKSTSETRN